MSSAETLSSNGSVISGNADALSLSAAELVRMPVLNDGFRHSNKAATDQRCCRI